MPSRAEWARIHSEDQRYGEQGSRYPVEDGDIWHLRSEDGRSDYAEHYVACGSILNSFRGRGPHGTYWEDVDVFYTDPPWNASACSTFYGRAGHRHPEKDRWLDIHERIVEIAAGRPCWMEGTAMPLEREQLVDALSSYPGLVCWTFEVTWRPNRSPELREACLHYVGRETPAFDPTGLDTTVTPDYVLSAYPQGIVGEPCAGSGTTVIAAERAGWGSRSSDLQPRRVSQVLARLHDLGAGQVELVRQAPRPAGTSLVEVHDPRS